MADFTRPALVGQEQIGKTGKIDFDVTLRQVSDRVQVIISGKTSADDQAMCAVVLAQSAEGSALASLRGSAALAAAQNPIARALNIPPSDLLVATAMSTNPGGAIYEGCLPRPEIGELLAPGEKLSIVLNFDNENHPTGSSLLVTDVSGAARLRVDAFVDDATGEKRVSTTDLADNFDWDKEIKSIHPDGLFDEVIVADNGNISDYLWGGGNISAGEIAAVFGSNLGRLLGGNNLALQISTSTVIGAVGKEIGYALEKGVSFSLDHIIGEAFGSLNGGIGSFPSAGIGALSALLMGELADALGLQHEGRTLFTGVTASVTTQLVTNVYGMATGAVVPNSGGQLYTIATGFNAAQIITNAGSIVGGILGSMLGAQVVSAHYEEGALGGSVGSAIGGAIGTAILPGIGSFIGSFLGQVGGTLLGDLLGNDPEAHGQLWFNPANARYELLNSSFSADHGGDAAPFMVIAQHQANVVNKLIATSGARVAAMSNRVERPLPNS